MTNTSSIDGRSAFLNELAQHDHVDYFQFFAKFHKKSLPSKLPADRRYNQMGLATPRVQEQSPPARTGNDTASQIKAVENKYKLKWIRQRQD